MKIIKKVIPLMVISLLSYGLSVQAASVGDWTEKFTLKGGNSVVHTPNYVNFDGWMQGGKGIDITSKSINGTPLTSCGLHLKTESSRAKFIDALTCSGLYPA